MSPEVAAGVADTEREANHGRFGDMRMSRRTVDAAVALVAFLIGVVVMVDTYRLGAGWSKGSPESGYFPFRIGVIICLASAVILVRALLRGRRNPSEIFVRWSQARLVLAVLIPTLVYILGIALVGIYVASALFIAGFMRVSGRYGTIKAIVVGAAIGAVLFWLFEIQFLVPLPKGPVESWLGY
jgi:putative tricarboxylic transport membrane protein